ncbi:MAG: response regulator, partial [Deltaproteobacteria bacterium]|nr:response regulator [Deltaproteobacteria bacterium]
RILVAEDDYVNQQVISEILQKFGYYAEIVVNGHEAVAKLEQHDFDLVLMDVQMPEMDGIEATQIIRDPVSRVRDHKVPVIAVTAHAMAGDRERFLEAGMDDYVAKPLQMNELIEMIRRFLPQANNDLAC